LVGAFLDGRDRLIGAADTRRNCGLARWSGINCCVVAGLRQTEAFATSSREGCGRVIAARPRKDPTTEILSKHGSGSAVVPAMAMIAFPAAGLPPSAPQISFLFPFNPGLWAAGCQDWRRLRAGPDRLSRDHYRRGSARS